jgi:hypothetical protein
MVGRFLIPYNKKSSAWLFPELMNAAAYGIVTILSSFCFAILGLLVNSPHSNKVAAAF